MLLKIGIQCHCFANIGYCNLFFHWSFALNTIQKRLMSYPKRTFQNNTRLAPAKHSNKGYFILQKNYFLCLSKVTQFIFVFFFPEFQSWSRKKVLEKSAKMKCTTFERPEEVMFLFLPSKASELFKVSGCVDVLRVTL